MATVTVQAKLNRCYIECTGGLRTPSEEHEADDRQVHQDLLENQSTQESVEWSERSEGDLLAARSSRPSAERVDSMRSVGSEWLVKGKEHANDDLQQRASTKDGI